MKYIEKNFLVERHFTDWTDLQVQFLQWSTTYANARVHGVTKKIPKEVFVDEEKCTLQPLPRESFALFERCERKVQSNCHIFFQNHYYSVPARVVGKVVTVRWSGALLKVMHQAQEIACHVISQEVGGFTTCRSHLPEYKCYGATEHQQKYESKMADIGEAAHTYFQEILIKQETYWFRSVRIILGLAHMYGNEAVNLSLVRAREYHVTDTSIIKQIVVKQLYLLDAAPRLLKHHAVSVVSFPTPSTFLSEMLGTVTHHRTSMRADAGPSSQVTDLNRDLQYYQQLLEGET